MVLDELACPIVLAPLAGGPSTPELAAAVAGAGGLGFIATGYLSAAEARSRIEAAQALTPGRLGVNVFAHDSPAADAPAVARYAERLRAWAGGETEIGEPRWDDDDWEAKLDLLADASLGVPVVSFTFGCPGSGVVERLQAAGAEVWVTITTPDEARQAMQAGADVLVVQGAEAGGHRASFVNDADLPVYGLLPLIDLVAAAVPVPLVASGGIATGRAVAAVLCAGARAAQVGTAFLLAPEAGTAPVHRQALRTSRETVLTRAFTGRLARGIRNRFIDEHEAHAPVAYPELHHLTAPLRRRARQEGEESRVNLWAGEAHALAVERPAAETVSELTRTAAAALREAVQQPWLR